MWLAWLLLGAFLGFMAAALVVASARGDLAAELQRLRALEHGLELLELRVIDNPGIGTVFKARLIDVLQMWKWAHDDGRWILAEGLSVSPIVVIDEIGDPIK